MAIITMPDGLYIERMSWNQQRNDLESRGPFGGQALENGAPQWAVSINFAKMKQSESGPLKALLMKLRGRTDQLEVWDVARPQPLGTLRGALTLNAPVAQGATSMQMVSASSNLISNSDLKTGAPYQLFDVVDEAIDNGTLAPDGSIGARKFTVSATPGIVRFGDTDSGTPNTSYAGSIWIKTTDGSAKTASLQVNDVDQPITLTGVWQRFSTSATTNNNYRFLDADNLPVGSYHMWGVKLEVGSQATDYGFGKTLLEGDWLGIGSGSTQQVVMVMDDAVSVGQGVIDVNFQAPLRNAFPVGTVVTWDKPKALFRRQNSRAGWEYESAFASGFALDLLEDWRP